MAAERRRPRLGGRVVAGVVVAAAVVAGVVVWTTRGGSGPSYRIAVARLASVSQTLDSVGTVSAANKASASFPVAGTVSSVSVTLGDTVRAGQRLARLDTTSLRQQVDSASGDVSSAKQTLADAENGQVSTTGAQNGGSGSGSGGGVLTQSAREVQLTPSTTPSPASSASPAPSSGTGAGKGAGKGSAGSSGGASAGASGASTVTALQQQVIAQQQRIDADLLTLRGTDGTGGELAQATACAAGGTADCSTLLSQVADLEARIADEQATQKQYEQDLDSAIAALQTSGTTKSTGPSAAPTSGQQPTRGSQSGSGAPGTSGSQRTSAGSQSQSQSSSQSSSSSGGQTASAAQLAAYQAHVDSAKANLTVARQNLSAATLTSPISGTVADVSITAGEQVSADSSSATITVIGVGGALVNTTVSLADIDLVKVGQPASVDVDGISKPLIGTVASIGVLDTTTGSSTTYPVTVQLAADSPRVYDGVSAGVSITVATATNVLTVPTSAVHSIGSFHTVSVLDSGSATTVRVTTGVAGAERTQISSGLKAGQQVVLANLNEPLPSNDTTSRFGSGLGTGAGRTALTSGLSGSGLGSGGGLGGGGFVRPGG